MTKDQLKAAHAAGCRIQIWHLVPGATSSADGQWDDADPTAAPTFECPAHLYRVHPDDLHKVPQVSGGGESLNEPFGNSEELREAIAGLLAVSFPPEFDGCPDEVKQAYSYWHGRLVRFAGAIEFDAALSASGGEAVDCYVCEDRPASGSFLCIGCKRTAPQPSAPVVDEGLREHVIGCLPAPIGNPEAWPPGFADGYNACAEIANEGVHVAFAEITQQPAKANESEGAGCE